MIHYDSLALKKNANRFVGCLTQNVIYCERNLVVLLYIVSDIKNAFTPFETVIIQLL